ncbi:hypothetical protein AMC99_01496 [Altererythrobacter epoxidivorans]|uniref:Uncharacterized protein n=1 Tax=Altererythrobacter epoxidivorans TaxID=361183 RepID=A0A0M4MVX8_9SPHN|nr:hypothetical protein AMC99_01496 [Altererythrobacter epoxidivorans]
MARCQRGIDQRRSGLRRRWRRSRRRCRCRRWRWRRCRRWRRRRRRRWGRRWRRPRGGIDVSAPSAATACHKREGQGADAGLQYDPITTHY